MRRLRHGKIFSRVRRVPYPFMIPANYLRADLIPREHGDLADKVKVRTYRVQTMRNMMVFGLGREHLPARAIQPPVRT